MTYVDGFVLVVPKKNFATYKKVATEGAKIWKKHGALEYFECVGDDLIIPDMQKAGANNFLKMAKVKKGETVWFSFIVFKSKKHRNEVNKKVMKDPAMSAENWKDKPMPFDMKRMAYGGFKAVIEAKK